MIEKKNFRCLMILLPNGKTIFTEKDNHDQLIELAKTLKAKLILVKVVKAQILELNELAKAISNGQSWTSDFIKLGIVKSKKLGLAPEIQNFMSQCLKSGNVLTISSLTKRYGVTSQYVTNILNKIKKELDVVRVKRGSYAIKPIAKKKKSEWVLDLNYFPDINISAISVRLPLKPKQIKKKKPK